MLFVYECMYYSMLHYSTYIEQLTYSLPLFYRSNSAVSLLLHIVFPVPTSIQFKFLMYCPLKYSA